MAAGPVSRRSLVLLAFCGFAQGHACSSYSVGALRNCAALSGLAKYLGTQTQGVASLCPGLSSFALSGLLAGGWHYRKFQDGDTALSGLQVFQCQRTSVDFGDLPTKHQADSDKGVGSW